MISMYGSLWAKSKHFLIKHSTTLAYLHAFQPSSSGVGRCMCIARTWPCVSGNPCNSLLWTLLTCALHTELRVSWDFQILH